MAVAPNKSSRQHIMHHRDGTCFFCDSPATCEVYDPSLRHTQSSGWPQSYSGELNAYQVCRVCRQRLYHAPFPHEGKVNYIQSILNNSMSSRPSSLIIEATDDDTKDLDWISDHVEDIICLIYRVEYALQLTAKTQALRMYALSRIVTQGITKGSKSLNVPNTLKVHGIHGEFVEMFFVSKSRRMW